MRSGPRQGAPGIGEPAGKTADNGFFFDSLPPRHAAAIIQDRTEAAETDAAAERPDGRLRTAPAGAVRSAAVAASGRLQAPDDPRPPARHRLPGRPPGRRNFRGRFGPGSVLGGRYTSGSPGKAFPGFGMIAGIRRKPRLCKDSGGNRAGRSGPNGLFVSSILNSMNRLFDRLRAPAARRAGPGRQRSPVSPACRHEAASWRRAGHAA